MKTLIILFSLIPLSGVTPEKDFKLPEGVVETEFIEKYAYWSVRFMNIYGDPASIKMAQMILESTEGKSKLAVEYNNFVGITCQSCDNYVKHPDKDKDGKKVHHKFVIFKSPWACMKAHSMKLKNTSWYQDCYYNVRNVRAGTLKYCERWLDGLQSYDKGPTWAVDRKYKRKIMNIVKRHNLHLLDVMNLYDCP